MSKTMKVIARKDIGGHVFGQKDAVKRGTVLEVPEETYRAYMMYLDPAPADASVGPPGEPVKRGGPKAAKAQAEAAAAKEAAAKVAEPAPKAAAAKATPTEPA